MRLKPGRIYQMIHQIEGYIIVTLCESIDDAEEYDEYSSYNMLDLYDSTITGVEDMHWSTSVGNLENLFTDITELNPEDHPEYYL